MPPELPDPYIDTTVGCEGEASRRHPDFAADAVDEQRNLVLPFEEVDLDVVAVAIVVDPEHRHEGRSPADELLGTRLAGSSHQ